MGYRRVHHRKNALKPCQKRLVVEEPQRERPGDTSKACRLLKTSRSSLRYRSKKDDAAVQRHLQRLATAHPVEGFWKCYRRLRSEGVVINHKRLHRVYKEMKLPLRRKVKKRLPARVQAPLTVPEAFAL